MVMMEHINLDFELNIIYSKLESSHKIHEKWRVFSEDSYDRWLRKHMALQYQVAALIMNIDDKLSETMT